jgi:hypothetical protein
MKLMGLMVDKWIRGVGKQGSGERGAKKDEGVKWL